MSLRTRLTRLEPPHQKQTFDHLSDEELKAQLLELSRGMAADPGLSTAERADVEAMVQQLETGAGWAAELNLRVMTLLKAETSRQ